MNREMDVALRLRLDYAPGGARAALRDVEALRAAAARLNGTTGGQRVAQDIQKTGAAAKGAGRDVADLARAADRLGATGANKLETDLQKTASAARSAEKDLARAKRAAGGIGGNWGELDQKIARIGPASARATRDLTGLGRAADRLGTGGGVGKLEHDIERVGRRADETRRKVAAIPTAPAGAGGLAAAAERLGSGNLATAAAAAGAARLGMGGVLGAGGAAAAITGGLAIATHQAMAFETAMAGVRAAATDMPATGVRQIEGDILRLSRTTGLAKTEIAGLYERAIRLGVPKASTELSDFSTVAAKASVAWRMPLQETGQSLGQIRKEFKLDPAALARAADAVSSVGDHTGAGGGAILKFLEKVSGRAQMHHLPIAQAAAFGGSAMGLGLSEEEAASSLDTLLGRFGNAGRQGKEFQRGLRGINLTPALVQANLRQNPIKGLLDVLERIDRLPITKKPGVMADLFGTEGGGKIAHLVEGVAKLRAEMERVSDPANFAGDLERKFSIFDESTTRKIDRMAQALASLAERIGRGFTPILGVAAEAITAFVNRINSGIDATERLARVVPLIAEGKPLDPADAKALKANPELDRAAREQARRLERERIREAPEGDESAARQHRQGILDDLRQRIERRGAAGLDTSADQRKLEETERKFRELHPDLPGADKRSEIPGHVRATFAAYHDEIERAEERTLRATRDFAREMRKELALDSSGRFGEARIVNASLPGGGRLFGEGGRFGGIARGSGAGPGRFAAASRPRPAAAGAAGVEAAPRARSRPT